MDSDVSTNRKGGGGQFMAAIMLTLVAAVPFASAGTEDICGCAGSPSLGEFRSVDEESYPPGTIRSGSTITIPLSADGRFVFDSFTAAGIPGNPSSGVQIRFVVNQADQAAANEPVRLLVSGDVFIAAGAQIDVSGFPSAASASDPRGGIGGPGGFRGGDGAFQQTTLTRAGGHGLGPGGGRPGDANAEAQQNLYGHDGTFVGNDELMPLIGGGGGGGGSASRDDCAAGGGGGGGGALLIAANGTLTLNGSIVSYGGGAGSSPNCGNVAGVGFGGAGASGAVHVVADAIAGNGQVYANSAQPGRIRLDAFDISPDLSTYPVATRSFSPVAEGAPRLAIATVNGESMSRASELPIAERPQGVFGQVDVVVSGSDPVTIGLTSEGVTGGVGVEVSAKRRTGGQRFTTSATLGDCSPLGQCTATAVFSELPAGTYFIEAKAVFQ